MDWATVRVLTKNLRELFDQMAAGDHIPEQKEGESAWDTAGSVKESWRVGILTVGSALLSELGMQEDGRSIHHSWESFSWPGSEQFKRNPYIRTAEATLEVAEKLLEDYDAEMNKAEPNQ